MAFASIGDGIGLRHFDFETLENDVQTAHFAREAIVCAACTARILNDLVGRGRQENEVPN